MNPKGPRQLGDIVAGARPAESALGRLTRDSEARVLLADHVRSGVSAELAAAILSCNLREDGTLVVTTSSPVWAARLRFENLRLLEHCRTRFPQTVQLRIRVGTDSAGDGVRTPDRL